ncbi:MAG: uroporphyrinogen-III synthase [Novosphingobium sp.]|nr:uroporphyrinogen-III synthase [Novosphingobium sp.]
MNALPLIVIRPEPGGTATLAAALQRGLDAHAFPLFDVEPRSWQIPQGGFDAILAGSANVFRHGGPQLASLTAIPVMAVGATTADAARTAGFKVMHTGEGGLQPLVEALPAGNYLRLAGQDRVTLTAPAQVRIITEVVYAARARPIPAALVALLGHGGVIALHSGEAARHFAAECERLGIPRNRLYLACLAPRITDLAGPGWGAIETARTRTDTDLLELAARMCQTV